MRARWRGVRARWRMGEGQVEGVRARWRVGEGHVEAE